MQRGLNEIVTEESGAADYQQLAAGHLPELRGKVSTDIVEVRLNDLDGSGHFPGELSGAGSEKRVLLGPQFMAKARARDFDVGDGQHLVLWHVPFQATALGEAH